jgi:hypothetical protein
VVAEIILDVVVDDMVVDVGCNVDIGDLIVDDDES